MKIFRNIWSRSALNMTMSNIVVTWWPSGQGWWTPGSVMKRKARRSWVRFPRLAVVRRFSSGEETPTVFAFWTCLLSTGIPPVSPISSTELWHFNKVHFFFILYFLHAPMALVEIYWFHQMNTQRVSEIGLKNNSYSTEHQEKWKPLASSSFVTSQLHHLPLDRHAQPAYHVLWYSLVVEMYM